MLNQPIGDWDISQVTAMPTMFLDNSMFMQASRDWDTSQVTTMQSMFQRNSVFNRTIGGGHFSSVATVASLGARRSMVLRVPGGLGCVHFCLFSIGLVICAESYGKLPSAGSRLRHSLGPDV